MICRKKAIIILTMAFVFILSKVNAEPSAENHSHHSHHFYFSLADEFGGASKEAISEFDCSDKIYAVLELKNYNKKESYQLSVKWHNPQGHVQEHTQYPFHVFKNETRLWAWISLHRATGAGMMQWLNPAAGLEEFIGEWEAEVRINGKLLDTKGFQVIC